jgi:predicted nucleotidyltransferase
VRDLITGLPARNAVPSLDELRARRAEILAACARNGASNVWVFGSVARGEQDDDSDLDLVVDIEPGRSLFDLAGLIGDVEDLLGCAVNVIEHCMLGEDRLGRYVRRDMVEL